MSYSIIIPARYESTRLPGKALRVLAGKPLIQHVYEQAIKSQAERVIIATDDERIATFAHTLDADVCMTGQHHRSGTERSAEVIEMTGIDDDEIIVNLQGDEPMMPPACLDQVAGLLRDKDEVAPMATLCEQLHSAADIFDPNTVKVIMDQHGYAMYFSRAPIPWHRDSFNNTTSEMPDGQAYFRHIGLYAYRAGFIRHYLEAEVCPLEKTESLEQLRVLYMGHKIRIAPVIESTGPGVDTQADLERVEAMLTQPA